MIYLDNAATSWPKPEGVVKAMEKVMLDFGSNPGRGSHQGTLGVGRLVLRTRELLAQLFGVPDPSRIVFTGNATQALNMGIYGMLETGDHVITTSMEHNSVWRPLKYLERRGVELEAVACDHEGKLNPADIQSAIKRNTKLIITTHASNVTGTVMPIEEIGKIAREHGIFYMVDAAQTAGVIPIDVEKYMIDLLAFPGHKGLLGPQGTGGLFVGPRVTLEPLIQGGTGSSSELEFQPEALPDRYESGTLNTVGIAGLGAGLEYILSEGLDKIYQRETLLCQSLISGLEKVPGIKIYGPRAREERAPLVSVNLGQVDANEIAFILDRAFGIAVRSGLHCAPQAHHTIGTLRQGTIRFSPSSFTSEQDIASAVQAMSEIAKELQG